MSEKEIIRQGIPFDNRYNYRVNKYGELTREKYNFWKDPYTYITLFVILAVIFHFVDKSACMQANKALTEAIEKGGLINQGYAGGNCFQPFNLTIEVNKTLNDSQT